MDLSSEQAQGKTVGNGLQLLIFFFQLLRAHDQFVSLNSRLDSPEDCVGHLNVVAILLKM